MDSSFRDVLLSPENPVMNEVLSITLKIFPYFLIFTPVIAGMIQDWAD